MNKSCQQCNATFEITPADLAFYKKVSPEINGKKHEVPPPKDCPDCRQQRRLSWRNERHFYNRKCDLCNKDLIAIYSKDKANKIYCPECYWSDKWDPMSYGKDFDFSRSFFEQFIELFNELPQMSLNAVECENSDYAHDVGRLKNCFQIFDGDQARDSMYGETFVHLSDCIDFLQLFTAELCYECVNSSNLYNCKFCFSCENCSDSWFLRDCVGCKNCFGCTNLRQQKYCIFNKKVSKAEYEDFISKFQSGNYLEIEKMKKKFEDFSLKQPVKYMHGLQNQDVSGDFVSNSKNAYNCFDCADLQDCKFCTNVGAGAKDCYDLDIWGQATELVYNSAVVGDGLQNAIGAHFSGWESFNLYYTIFCLKSTNNLFGCIGLRHKKYCIFNKQYSKEEYEVLASKIVEHMQRPAPDGTGEQWGEFFPTDLSPFGYNETVAQEYYPLSKEEVIAKGWKWKDEEYNIQNTTRTIPAERLPDDLKDIPDDILNWAIKCEESGRPFKIQKAELEFYRKQNLPIPHFHPDIRHEMRMAKRNPRKLWKRNCAKCKIKIETTYAPERPERVLCEECYLKEVN